MAKKLTYEEVKEYIESQGYKLLSGEYVNAKTKMTIQDEEGYLYITPWNNFRDKKQLLKFHKSNPYTIQNIKQFLKLNAEGYELLSTEYIGGHEKLIFKCPKGHEFVMAWSQFQIGQRCPKCLGMYNSEEIEYFYKKSGYKLINKYEGNNKNLFVENKEGYICVSKWATFKNGTEPLKFHLNNPYTIQNIKLWLKTNAEGYELLSDEYKGATNKLLFKCPKGHRFEADWHHFQLGKRCPYCSIPPRKIELGINTMWDTDRWMCDLGVSEEDAKTHSRCSNDKIIVICPHCKKKKEVNISHVYISKSIGCSCGDGTSYPEKFVTCLLDQLNVKYKREYCPEWSNNKRYDFYFEYDNKKYIVECNGEQHYKQTTRKGGRTLEEEQENDRLKEQLALNNGVGYIIIDCRYSELSWIKDNILNSKLSEIFDLISNIDWLKCEEFALSNRGKKICDYWNQKEEWETTIDLANKFNLSRSAIVRYLKKGTKLGWCNYNSKKESKKGNIKAGKIAQKSCSKSVEVFKDSKSLGVFPSCAELSRQSKELFGVELYSRNISAVCTGKRKHHKGFTFKYVEVS